LGVRPEHIGFGRLAPAEAVPARGSDILLAESEVRYCLFEAARLEAVRTAPRTPVQGAYLRLAIDDYNSRCAGFRADPGSLERLRRETQSRAGALRTQAGERMALWAASPAPPPREADSPLATGLRRLELSRPEDARAVQERLRALGYDPGPIDGVWGQRSHTALFAFKLERGLGTATAWDLVTQRRLFRAAR
jgi:hypothetical protein